MKHTPRVFRIRQRGFTLVEILVVLSILGALAVIAIPSVITFMHKGKAETAVTEFNIVERAVTHYMAENNGNKPNSLADLNPYILRGTDKLGWNYTINPDATVSQGDRK